MICGSCATKHGFALGTFCALTLGESEHIDDLLTNRLPITVEELRPLASAFLDGLKALGAERVQARNAG